MKHQTVINLMALLCYFFAAKRSAALLTQHQRHHRVVRLEAAAKGFGGSKPKTKKKANKKQVAKKIERAYGGTTPQQIAAATQQRIEAAMKALAPELQMATQLYQQLQRFNAYKNSLSLLQQAKLSQQEVEGAERAQKELDRLYEEHDLTQVDLHNLFQQITWDASADAKAARALTGEMAGDNQARVDRACRIVAEAVGKTGKCLDVACGFGVLVDPLVKAGVSEKQIYGVDLSKEMIRNAKEQHPRGPTFVAADFLKEYKDDDGFEAVIFCSALHDLPDMMASLEKAASLTRPGGSLVIVHPQGATHVLNQAKANPVMVKRGLPNAAELEALSRLGLTLTVAPAAAGSTEESKEGYLAVLRKD